MKQLQLATRKYHHIIAGFLLLLMFVLGVGSMREDSGIVDEVAHIPAGYSYIKLGDYRLNPEHPPLIKDMAALPLLGLGLVFPDTVPSWTTDINGQWESGWHFIYHVGNNADQILFYSRLPVLLLAIVLGVVLYLVALRRFGVATALLALFLYTLEPNIIAHSRFVTTDLGAAAFMFFSIVTFCNYLHSPTRKNLMIATIFFALVQLAKFSSVLLLPVFVFMIIAASLPGTKLKEWPSRFRTLFLGTFIMGVGSVLLVWLFYIPHTWNMPTAVQDRLIDGSLPGGWQRPVGQQLMKINDVPLVKPLAQYILGMLMVFNRVSGGNTTYFLGEVTNQSFVWYFPVTYLIKTPVAFLVMAIMSLFYAAYSYLKKTPLKLVQNFVDYSQDHLFELSGLFFIFFYSYMSITGNLNLGIRHLMPIMPFAIILVAHSVVRLVRRYQAVLALKVGFIVLVVYYAATNFIAYPAYLSYFNEFIGGPANADKYVSDSSVDWGQDLVRLKQFVDAHPEIDKIAVDYFGGGEPKYYFCDRRFDGMGNLIPNVSGYDCSKSKFVEWHAENGVFEQGSYMAVSETFLVNDLYWSKTRHDEGYAKLRTMKPIAKIGYSIHVYKLR
jgi:hypothetical protein